MATMNNFWDNDFFLENRWGHWWYPAYDKVGHFICHYFAARLTLMGLMSLDQMYLDVKGLKILAVIFWFLIGAGYEFVYEPRKGRKPSWKDMVANLIGDVLGVTI